MTLTERMVELAKLRDIVDASTAALAVLDAELAASPTGAHRAAVAEDLRLCKLDMTAVENEIRYRLVPELYHETGNKNPAEGVSIKIFKLLRYDPDEALKWAMNHAPNLVVTSLDIKKFEKVATTLGAPVEEIEDPRVTIAKDLSALL